MLTTNGQTGIMGKLHFHKDFFSALNFLKKVFRIFANIDGNVVVVIVLIGAIY